MSGPSGILDETAVGLKALMAAPNLRLVGITLTLLVFVEGAADVMVVLVALDLLEIGEGSAGWISATWAVGALFAGAGLAVLLDRGNLAAGLAAGSLLVGAGLALPGVWPVVLAAYLWYFLMGFGYTFVEVARGRCSSGSARMTLARVIGFLETSRLAAMAVGAIVAPVLVALFGIRGALLALGAVLPLLALLRWRALRAFEIGAAVSERNFSLLRGTPIFALR